MLSTDIVLLETARNRALDAADSARNAAIRTPEDSDAWRAQRAAYAAAAKTVERADTISLALEHNALDGIDARYVFSEIRQIQALSRLATRKAATAWMIAADYEEHDARVSSARRMWANNKK